MKDDLPIRYYGHPDLRMKAKKVEALTPEIVKICEEMLAKMLHHKPRARNKLRQCGFSLLRRHGYTREDSNSLREGFRNFAGLPLVDRLAFSDPRKD